jgi:hypothetical protein
LRVAPEPAAFGVDLQYPRRRPLLKILFRSFQTFDAMEQGGILECTEPFHDFSFISVAPTLAASVAEPWGGSMLNNINVMLRFDKPLGWNNAVSLRAAQWLSSI